MQEGEIEPLGSNQLVAFNVRILAATSHDLAAMVREGRFREDLFYRLHVLPVRVPPLRVRRSDIPALVEALGEDLALRNGVSPPELAADALALLAGQPWRGNIRELRNVLEQAVMRSDSPVIDAAQLVSVLREAGIEPAAPVARRTALTDTFADAFADTFIDGCAKADGLTCATGSTPLEGPLHAPLHTPLHSESDLLRPLSEQIAQLERRAIGAALKAHNGNKLATARQLGISRATLYQRLENPDL